MNHASSFEACREHGASELWATDFSPLAPMLTTGACIIHSACAVAHPGNGVIWQTFTSTKRLDLPRLERDRTQLQLLGLTATDLAQDLLISTAGSTQTSPGRLNPRNGVVYNVAAQAPQHNIDSMDARMRTPVRRGSAQGFSAQPLSNLVTVRPAAQSAVLSRYT